MTYKTKLSKNTPPNFIDLGKPPKKSPRYLIQDVLRPTFKKTSSRIRVIIALLFIVAVGSIVVAVQPNQPNLVPLKIQKSVNFTVYYPDPAKLPRGYSLDLSSFSAGDHAVIYIVRYGNNQKLIFSVQTKPSASILQSFDSNVIPLNTNISTSIGTALIGSANGQTVVSLPSNGSSWIIMTGPYSTPEGPLRQVLEAF